MKTMLIVDDSEFMRSFIKKYVSELDIDVIAEAEDGATGYEKYVEFMPDFVTMDLAMYDENGLDVLKKIMAKNPNAKVIIISSIAGQEMIAKNAIALGAKGIIDKSKMQIKIKEVIGKLMEE